jgi:hypothetical protein
LGVPLRTQLLGPVSLRDPETLAEGKLTLRVAESYFAISTLLGPVAYRLSSSREFTAFGSDLQAKTGVLDLTLNYGITARVEANLNLPVVAVGAQASEVYPSVGGSALFGPSPGSLSAAPLKTVPYSQIAGVSFNDGAHAGVGRISLGTKALLYVEDPFRLAASCDFYLPSPNREQFAGSDTASILPRVIGSARLTDWMRLLVDTGYDYDFGSSQLRRFGWDVGVSFPLRAATFDLGMGGSEYATPIQWTPTRIPVHPGELTAVGDNQTGRNYVDFLTGVKFRLTDRLVMSGAVNIPVARPGVQPIAGGTVALRCWQ